MESQERIEWFAKRAQLSLSLSVDQKKMLLHDTHYRQIINNFFTIPDKTLLRVSIKNKLSNLQNHWNDEIYLSNNIPTRIDGKTLFLIKTNDLANANLDNIDKDLLTFEVDDNAFKTILNILKHIYLPLQSNKYITNDGVDSSRSISIHDNATIIELLHKIIVNIQLSIADFEDKITVVSPSMESLEQLAYSDQGSEFASSIMENIVLHWLKVIKKLLIKTDVFEYAKEKNKTADILDEIHVWQMYHESLLTIKNQLDTVSSHEIIDKLSESKSACISHLNRYLIEIERIIMNSEDVLKFLHVTKKLFEKFNSNLSFNQLFEILNPILRLIAKMWTYSVYYHENANVLLQLFANQVTLVAYDKINMNFLENPQSTWNNVQMALSLCARFRGNYLDIK